MASTGTRPRPPSKGRPGWTARLGARLLGYRVGWRQGPPKEPRQAIAHNRVSGGFVRVRRSRFGSAEAGQCQRCRWRFFLPATWWYFVHLFHQSARWPSGRRGRTNPSCVWSYFWCRLLDVSASPLAGARWLNISYLKPRASNTAGIVGRLALPPVQKPRRRKRVWLYCMCISCCAFRLGSSWEGVGSAA